MKKQVYQAALLIVLMLLSACSQSESGEPAQKEAVLLFNFSTSTLDPHADPAYIPLRAGVVETLVRMNDETQQVEPWLAESWENTDPAHWTFQIREGVTFQNGAPLTADAVKQSLERAIDVNPAVAGTLNVASITADGQTLHIETVAPFAEFPSELVHPNTAIVDISTDQMDKAPIGTGPFHVTGFAPGSDVTLAAFDSYWAGTPKLDKAVFRFNEDAGARTLALEAGEADIVYKPEAESLSRLEALPGIKVDAPETTRVHQLTMNMMKPTLQDRNVRLALDALFNRQAIVDTVMAGQGKPADGPFPADSLFAPDYAKRQEGAAAAEALLAKAGYENMGGTMMKNGTPLTLSLITYGARPELPLIAQVFQSEAQKIGIAVDIQLVEAPEAYLTSNNSWDVSVYSNMTAPRGDAGYYLRSTYHPDGALNMSGLRDQKLTAMIDELNKTVGETERANVAKTIASYIHDETYHAFIVHTTSLVAYNADRVQHWQTPKSEYYMLTHELDVTE